jgi:hypothetical protein
MIVNGAALNSGTINGESVRSFGMSGVGIEIEKEVILQNAFTDFGITVSKSTTALATTVGIPVSKVVRNIAVPDYLTRNGFKPRITINGYIIPDNQICGIATIVRREGDVATLELELQPPAGAIDLFAYEGKTIVYDIIRSSSVSRLFTGKVNFPIVDLINKRIKLSCTDTRAEQIEAQLGTFKNSIGTYSPPKQGETALTIFQEVEERLTTVPYSLDFNAYGNYTYTPWAAKASADFVLGNSQVYYSEPKVTFASRHKLINTVEINLSYRYPRLHKKVAQYSWTYPYPICTFLIEEHSSCTKAMIEAAVQGTGWQLLNTITYDPPFSSGSYYCYVSYLGRNQYMQWSTTQSEGTSTAVTTKNAAGESVAVLDSIGQPTYKQSITKLTDNSKLLCNGAYFKLQKKFAQTIIESYTLSVTAPQSVNQYGEVKEEFSVSVDTDYDTSLWENDQRTSSGTASAYTDQESNSVDFQTRSVAAIQKARVKILSAHRDTFISFRTPGWEAIDLSHTVELTTTPVQGKGKVQQITHTIDHEEGEFSTYIELAISRISGSASDSAIIPPTRIVDSPTTTTLNITLNSHYGEDPDSAIGLKWTGMIGNKTSATQTVGIGSVTPVKITNYTPQFRIDAPAIEASFREDRLLTASQTYNVAIPNDSLTVVI